jgi:hypothetical protein
MGNGSLVILSIAFLRTGGMAGGFFATSISGKEPAGIEVCTKATCADMKPLSLHRISTNKHCGLAVVLLPGMIRFT